ncbi:hypothetical protein [Actinomadura citrea]|jgi:hypothetical protein|uniref:Uncharacterized protein n=1 Tax=Actinomadura citrea TaxID=46158 RepID=A0A7Y9GAT3_9ACTN|nr:hypothetical protein [Actinomadura citrea]NYE13110.1 hypothetical protein [Actinomadura citrea]GGT88351.1 hypothetical protein GCM10010177_54490 [Actinomadura citrea]
MDQPARSVPASAGAQADLLNLGRLLEAAALLTCPTNADRDPRGPAPVPVSSRQLPAAGPNR